MENDTNNPDQPKASKQVEVKVPESHLIGVYANLSIISHSENEFNVDMARILPGTNQAHVVSRVVMSPRTAKGLLHALNENIANYENKFGEINLTQRGIPKGRIN